MRLLATSLSVLAAGAPVVLASATPAGAGISPHLQIEGTAPLVVAGSGFGPSEQITLRVSGGNLPRILHANAGGSFQVRLTSLHTFRCSGLIVVAAGASGQSASARLPRPACLSQRVVGTSTQ
jgi:hypothetical protein